MIRKKCIGKVHPDSLAQAVEFPCARVDPEQLVLAITRILLAKLANESFLSPRIAPQQLHACAGRNERTWGCASNAGCRASDRTDFARQHQSARAKTPVREHRAEGGNSEQPVSEVERVRKRPTGRPTNAWRPYDVSP